MQVTTGFDISGEFNFLAKKKDEEMTREVLAKYLDTTRELKVFAVEKSSYREISRGWIGHRERAINSRFKPDTAAWLSQNFGSFWRDGTLQLRVYAGCRADKYIYVVHLIFGPKIDGRHLGMNH